MKTKGKISKVLIGIVCVVAAMGIGVVVLIASYFSSFGRNLDTQLEMGAKYLSELEYDQAIASYEAAIQIDPKCVDAYLGLADVYETKGEPLNAAQTLVFAYANVKDSDKVVVENKFYELADTYIEIRNALNDGNIVLGGRISRDDFNNFFHMGEKDSEPNVGEIVSDPTGLFSERMDADLNLDLAQFTLLGRPLGDWTYDSLRSSLGSYSEDHFFNEYYDEYSDRNVIQINENGTQYIMPDSGYKSWSIQTFDDNGTNSIMGSICNKPVETYVESICPGLYEMLQKHGSVQLRNGAAMIPSGPVNEICFFVDGGTFYLHIRDDIISNYGIDFNDSWITTTDNPQGDMTGSVNGDNGFGNMVSDINVDFSQYSIYGTPLSSWTYDGLADIMINSYEAYEQTPGVLWGEIREGDAIVGQYTIDNNITSIELSFENAFYMSFWEDDYWTHYQFATINGNNTTPIDIGVSEVLDMFNYTSRDYIEMILPGIYDSLVIGEYTPIGNGNSGDSIGVFEDGSFDIMTSKGRMWVSTNSDGTIAYVDFEFSH